MTESPNKYQKALALQYEMMKRGDYCDFSIVVEGKVYHVHKMVLGSRSPYFETLFSTQMRETSENKLELSDIDFEIFEIFLKYVYTCEISDLEQHAEKLLLCGEKYQLGELVELCEASLIKTLNVKNAASCLLLGHLLAREQLKIHSLLFIRKNWDAVMNTEGWENVISNHNLMTELESNLFSTMLNRKPAGAINASHRKRTWVFRYDVYQVPERFYIQSPTFTLSDGEDSTPWKFTMQLENHNLVLNLVHIGMHVTVPPILCSFAMKKSNSPAICSGAVETNCCFDVESICRKPLVQWPVDRDYDPRYRQEIEICVHLQISNARSDVSFQQSFTNTYFHEYLERSCFTDAIIELKGESFSVHKIILSAASPVFCEKFRVFRERYELEEDVEPQTFRDMLAVIYKSGEIPTTADLPLLKLVVRFKLNEKQKSLSGCHTAEHEPRKCYGASRSR
uniref:BTB domain-containing protein n=1 Tax=Lygus hesperus TaxID=30085 RepID=A0A0K8SFE6_LYGHE